MSHKATKIGLTCVVLVLAFGGLLSVCVLIVAAKVLHPQGVDIDKFEQMAGMMSVPFPKWGKALFATSMAITCLGAALEIALSISYMFGEGLGWNSSENSPRRMPSRSSASIARPSSCSSWIASV